MNYGESVWGNIMQLLKRMSNWWTNMEESHKYNIKIFLKIQKKVH